MQQATGDQRQNYSSMAFFFCFFFFWEGDVCSGVSLHNCANVCVQTAAFANTFPAPFQSLKQDSLMFVAKANSINKHPISISALNDFKLTSSKRDLKVHCDTLQPFSIFLSHNIYFFSMFFFDIK